MKKNIGLDHWFVGDDDESAGAAKCVNMMERMELWGGRARIRVAVR